MFDNQLYMYYWSLVVLIELVKLPVFFDNFVTMTKGKGNMQKFVVFICLFLSANFIKAQSYEFAITAGAANYSGDLTQNISGSLNQTMGGGGTYFRYDFSNMFSIKCQYLFLMLGADDKKAKQSWQQQRGLHFRSDIHEIGLLGQLNLKGFVTEYPGRWNPNFSFGLSVFSFKPKTKFQGSWVSLREIGTEGQGMRNYALPYKKWSAGLTFGFGIRYFLTPSWSMTLDLLSRQTLTDYLDDASGNYVDYDALLAAKGQVAAELGNKIRAIGGSQRANSVDKDWYTTLMISLAYHLGKDFGYKEFRYRKKPVHCPGF